MRKVSLSRAAGRRRGPGSARSGALLLIAGLALAPAWAEPPAAMAPRAFVSADYDSRLFRVSRRQFAHGQVSIRVTQVKNAAGSAQSPYFCRAWLEIVKDGRVVWQEYYDEIEPAGYKYGLFVPTLQPSREHFLVVKVGDQDGRLFLIRRDGQVANLLGGSYFLTGDKRYLFSEYASDAPGLSVFDLVAGKILFSSEDLPAPYRWYTAGGAYFFTEAEYPTTNTGKPSERRGIAYFFEFRPGRIVARPISEAERARAEEIAFDFDPGRHDDCLVAPGSPAGRPGRGQAAPRERRPASTRE